MNKLDLSSEVLDLTGVKQEDKMDFYLYNGSKMLRQGDFLSIKVTQQSSDGKGVEVPQVGLFQDSAGQFLRLSNLLSIRSSEIKIAAELKRIGSKTITIKLQKEKPIWTKGSRAHAEE